MPVVEWPSRRRVRRRFIAVTTVVIGAMVLQFLPSIVQPQANAALAANSLPDNSVNSNPMSLVISESLDPGVINAPQDYVKIYLNSNDVGTAYVNIWNAPFRPCPNASLPDWYRPAPAACAGPSTAASQAVLYDFYPLDSAEDDPNLAAPMFTVNGQNGNISTGGSIANPVSGWSGNIPLPVAAAGISVNNGYRVWVMRARFQAGLAPADCGGGAAGPCKIRLHSYRMRTVGASDQLGYWEAQPGSPPSDGQYIIHYLGANCNVTPSACNLNVARAEFDIAPPCSQLADAPATLKWFDADWQPAGSLGPWYKEIYFDFLEYDPSGTLQATKTVNGTGSVPAIGGNNQYKEWTFTSHPGWKYRWVWHNLNGPAGVAPNWGAANNIQMWLPFDSINYDLTCYNYHSTVSAVTVPGGTPGAPTTLDFANPANQTITFDVNVSNTLNRAGPPPFVTPRVYSVVGAAGFASLQSQSWSAANPIRGPIPGNTAINNVGQFTYFLSNSTPTGTVLCFGDHIRPNQVDTDPGIDNDEPPYNCYYIKNDRRYPAITGYEGDIHGGGMLCGNPINNGNVSGNANMAGSFGEFVVSASGLINDFPSAGGSGALNLGANGSYQPNANPGVCREDLYTNAAGHSSDPGMHTLTPGSYPIDGMSGVYFATGDVGVHGTLKNKVTIINGVGNVTIDGDIKLQPGTNFGGDPRNVPTLGVITGSPANPHNINILPGVTVIDGYLFSEGAIDTCYTGAAIPPLACANTLTLRGFLMANDIIPNRTGPKDTIGSRLGENLSLVPLIYLNPPFFFDASADGSAYGSLGERQPLF